MGAIASQITSLTIVYSTVFSDADQWKHQSSTSLAFVWGIHRGPVNSPHKWPVTLKMFPFDDVIMVFRNLKYPSNSDESKTLLILFVWLYSISARRIEGEENNNHGCRFPTTQHFTAQRVRMYDTLLWVDKMNILDDLGRTTKLLTYTCTCWFFEIHVILSGDYPNELIDHPLK